MILTALGRALLLALCLLISCFQLARAHSLPGSTLLLSQQEETLNLSISFALDDLIIASPIFEPLAKQAAGQAVSQEYYQYLKVYFEEHSFLEHSSIALPLTLTKVSLGTQQHHDVGSFTIISSELSIPLSSNANMFPIELTYDVIMHEVRNHRATAYYEMIDSEPVRIANFGYRSVEGQQQKILLQKP